MIDFADIIIFYGAQNFIASEIDIDKQFASFEHGTLRNYIWANEEIPIKSLKGYKKSKIIKHENVLQDIIQDRKTHFSTLNFQVGPVMLACFSDEYIFSLIEKFSNKNKPNISVPSKTKSKSFQKEVEEVHTKPILKPEKPLFSIELTHGKILLYS